MQRLLLSAPLRLALVLLALCGAASAASAQDIAWTTAHANLRTGPDSGYPRILTVPAGQASSPARSASVSTRRTPAWRRMAARRAGGCSIPTGT